MPVEESDWATEVGEYGMSPTKVEVLGTSREQTKHCLCEE